MEHLYEVLQQYAHWIVAVLFVLFVAQLVRDAIWSHIKSHQPERKIWILVQGQEYFVDESMLPDCDCTILGSDDGPYYPPNEDESEYDRAEEWYGVGEVSHAPMD